MDDVGRRVIQVYLPIASLSVPVHHLVKLFKRRRREIGSFPEVKDSASDNAPWKSKRFQAIIHWNYIVFFVIFSSLSKRACLWFGESRNAPQCHSMYFQHHYCWTATGFPPSRCNVSGYCCSPFPRCSFSSSSTPLPSSFSIPVFMPPLFLIQKIRTN